MKRLMPTTFLINEIDRYRQTVSNLSNASNDLIWFPLFINDISVSENVLHKKHDTVALAYAIKAISETKVLSDSDCNTVKKGIKMLLDCRNSDYSWSTFYSSVGMTGQGIVFNTLTILDILIELGYLDKKSRFRTYQDSVREEVKCVLEDLSWVQKMSALENSGNDVSGWSYCADSTGKCAEEHASTLLTAFALSVYKKIVHKIESEQPDYFEEAKEFDKGHPFGANGKIVKDELLAIIKKIEQKLIETQNSDGGWGKAKGASSTVAHSFAVFNALTDSLAENEAVKTCLESFHSYLKSVANNSKRRGYFSSLRGNDIFDSYPQYVTEANGSVGFEIIDHETFVEPLIIRSVVKYVDFCFKNKISYPVTLRKKMYSLIVASMSSIRGRMENISGHHAIRTRRGLYSQSHPLYAIVQVISAWTDVVNHKARISWLLNFLGKLQYWLTTFGILALTGLTNWVLLRNNEWWQIVAVTTIGFGLEFCKDIIAKKKKMLE